VRPLAGTLPIKRAAHVYLVRESLLGQPELLLVSERMDDGSIFWGLPGGRAEGGEALIEAAARQVAEETGLIAEDLNFLSLLEGELLPDTPHHHYATFARFTGRWSGSLAPTDPEVLSAEWIPFSQVISLVRYGPPPEIEERNPLIWRPTRDFLAGSAKPYYLAE
jgi:ADP-ribose pyrophosphatase YjhB (NUDIX family)